MLAAVLDRPADAARHFEVAIDVERRMRAWPWLTHAKHDYGAMLLAHGDGADADTLLEEALATYREVGMDPWADRVAALTQPARS